MYLGEPMIELTMLIHTKYNEYDAVIRPMEAYLEKKGVRFRKGTRVRDIETEQKGKETLATGLVYDDDSGRQRIELTRDDLVFFTNGSMVQKTTWGDNDTVANLRPRHKRPGPVRRLEEAGGARSRSSAGQSRSSPTLKEAVFTPGPRRSRAIRSS